MARIVILHFDDNAKAEEFVQDIQAGGGVSDTFAGQVERFKCEPLAMYAVPSQFCNCGPDWERVQKGKPSRRVRGKRWGWWVDPRCGKPEVDSPQTGYKNLLRRFPTEWYEHDFHLSYCAGPDQFRRPEATLKQLQEERESGKETVDSS